METQIISISYAARLLTFKCHGNPNMGWSKFECINEPGLPLSNKYIVQQPTLNLHSSTVTWLSQLMNKECFDGWAVHSCDGANKDIGGSWIELSIVIVKRQVDHMKGKVEE